MEQLFKGAMVAGGAAVGLLFGGWHILVQVLMVFVIADYLTGILAGIYNGELSSKVGFKGIAKKIAIFILVAIAHQVDFVLGDKDMLRDAVIFFYLANELISMLENAARMGLNIPGKLKQVIGLLQEKAGEKGKKE
ncbi:phage holin [Listeria grandensis FSL F6-0971]|uniref:Phage holin n=1 Tax=Listeria grandensis FSL F6-0971 TaxID=1265819 RepID=W7B6S9_9LIST|nr:phage holin family protein [Listeria grandensis]EUJ22999.1 phage holin [Listeria grandensis FSL F6-0971]